MRFTLITLVVMFLLGVAQPQGCGGECCDVSTTDAGSDAGVVDDANSDAGTVDATSADTATDDSAVDDAGDPCTDYYWLEDGQEWECTGVGTYTCVWEVTQDQNGCGLLCPGIWGEYFGNSNLQVSETEVVYSRGGTDVCTPP